MDGSGRTMIRFVYLGVSVCSWLHYERCVAVQGGIVEMIDCLCEMFLIRILLGHV